MGIEVENIRDWQGKAVIDRHGGKIGDMEAVYVDTVTDEPAFVTVAVGMFGRKRLAFVPLGGATVAPAHIKVIVDKDSAKNAPSIEPDGELAATDEPAIFEHYGIDAPPAGARRLARR